MNESHDRLLFGSHETSPIIWIGKPAQAIQFLAKKSSEMFGSNQTNTVVSRFVSRILNEIWRAAEGKGGRVVRTHPIFNVLCNAYYVHNLHIQCRTVTKNKRQE
jgi:hypothetical protein